MTILSSIRIQSSMVVLVCATVFTPAAAHDPLDWNGDKIQVLLDKKVSGGDLGIFTVTTPGPGGPGRHVHTDASEAFYVLEGEAEFLSDGKMFTLKKGESAFVPRGIEHTFRVSNKDGGKILVIVTPAGFEGFFEATKHLSIPADMEQISKISEEQFGQKFTGPPLKGK